MFHLQAKEVSPWAHADVVTQLIQKRTATALTEWCQAVKTDIAQALAAQGFAEASEVVKEFKKSI